LMEEFDPKLLAKARIEHESVREKDLPGHITNEHADDFSTKELEALASKKEGDPKNDDSKDEEMTPDRTTPKQDYQVVEAVKYLKSFEIFNNLSQSRGKGVSPDSEKK